MPLFAADENTLEILQTFTSAMLVNYTIPLVSTHMQVVVRLDIAGGRRGPPEDPESGSGGDIYLFYSVNNFGKKF